jgi:flagellar biosynthesis protein FliQ
MTEDFIIGFARQALETMLMVSLPVLLVSLVVGVIISLFQSVTQMQEMTITFVPKIIATFLSLIVFGAWMIEKMTGFMREVLVNLPYWVR